MPLPQDESERVAVISGRSEDSTIAVSVVGRTDVGLVREHNEDNYLLADLATGSREPQTFHEVSSAGLLLAVCDGMGGAAAGEVASQMAVDTLYEMMHRSAPTADRDGLARNLVRSIEEAGGRIFESARADRSRRGMGTTATVAALMDKTLFVGQVGDSRAYIMRNGELKQITKDQSLVNQLIEAGQLTEDEAEAFEHSNIILQALGTTEQVSVDLTFLELRRGDRLMMCSDGLSGLVHGDMIREVMRDEADLDTCCERLVDMAKAGGGHDNVTVILAQFDGPGLAPPQAGDLVGYQQYPLPLEEGRRPSPLHSDMPTLSPPPNTQPVPASELSGAGLPRTQPVSGGAGGRLFLVAMLIAGAAGALYYWMDARDQRARRLEAHQMAEPAVPSPPAVARVEVFVETDVEAGELLVDGESYGIAAQGQWVLDLPPGLHKLEARAGDNSVTSATLTVREGVPATVMLSMPEGASLASDASTESDAAAQPDASVKSRRHERARERELAAEPTPTPTRSVRAQERERAAGDGRARPLGTAVRDDAPVRDVGEAATPEPRTESAPQPSAPAPAHDASVRVDRDR
ncbi:MAG: Stp1/IreP family PP2C-type Ser/Thr phosphatase [Polyangiales bacterium]